MAPKKDAVAKGGKKRRVDSEGGQGSGGNLEPNWTIHRSNRYLFRDIVAYENYAGSFINRKITECYRFDKSVVTFSQPEDDKVIAYVNHWGWEPIVTCFEPYTQLLTRTFYANIKTSDEPYMITSWVGGKEIVLSLNNVAQWLGVENDGEETYPLRSWPLYADGSSNDYKKWFDRNYISGSSIYASHLPSLHRLLFLFINNILMPKATIKTNLEWGPMYFLRHLIQMDGKRINIPYFFLRHINGAFSTTNHSLPYAHLIHKIIRLNSIQLPEDAEVSFPTSLVDHLTRIGWVHGHSESGLRRYEPDARAINQWINHPEALPNQYWDSEEEVVPAQPQPQPQPQYMPQAGAFVPPQGQEAQMLWLCQQMHAQSLEIQQNHQATLRRFDNLEKGQMKIRKQLRAHARALNVLDEAQSSLSNCFIKQYGPSGSPARARENLVEEEDLDDEEEELENEGEEEVADAQNDHMDDQ